MSERPRARVVLATNNPAKLAELRAVVDGLEIPAEVLGLADLPRYPEPAETERSFEGNAIIKARECALAIGLPALADDSGLEVDVLNNCPGVRSARWAGPEGDDAANNELLLRQISDVPADERTGRFVCAMAFAIPDGQGELRHCEVVRREWPGLVATEHRGDNGFGYDSLFIPDDAPEVEGRRLHSAELSPEHKNEISHRGQAVRAMMLAVAALLNIKDMSKVGMAVAEPDDDPENPAPPGEDVAAIS